MHDPRDRRRRHGLRRLRVALTIALAACGDDGASPPDGPPASHIELGTCGVVDTYPLEAGIHVDMGTPIEWSTNPPASGKHYPIWAAFDRSYPDLARGNWLHDAEHGAIVFSYRCPAGCPDVVTALENVVRALPADPTCAAPVRQRALVVGDPLLPTDVQVAAIAWGVVYTATCVDPDALATFARDHYRRAPEDLCANGAAFGGTFIDP